MKLSGKRQNPFQVRVNTRIDEWGYPRYNVLAAFKHCEQLHSQTMPDISALDLQRILDRDELSYSMLEHIKTLFNQMYRYALQFEIVTKNYAEFVQIGKEDDTENGVPFTNEELQRLWEHKDKPFVDTILIYIYSGWRINELAGMPLENIDLEEQTFTGGLKNRYSRNRTVSIHSKIYNMVKARYTPRFHSLIYHDGTQGISEEKYREYFAQALTSCGITEKHTPHDCRHTCNSLLLKAKVDRVARYKIMGHF